uniref:Dynein light chain n=1 Tax=Electrophorus electricus TaxID=8005 RepID=A0AAY5EWE7_ELEEL
MLVKKLEEQNSHLAQVKVDEMLGLMGYVASLVILNAYLFDVGSNVLLNVVLLQSLRSTFHSVLLHLLGHVRIFDYCLPVRHGSILGWLASSVR